MSCPKCGRSSQSEPLNYTRISRNQCKAFTRIFLENILYERKLLSKGLFKDFTFEGQVLKKLRDLNNDKIVKNFNIFFKGIADSIEKGYVNRVVIKITLKESPETVLEQYELNYIYSGPHKKKACHPAKTEFSFKKILKNLRYSAKKYFDPLPPLEDLHIFMYIQLLDTTTPSVYAVPYFAKTQENEPTHITGLSLCNLGTFKTSRIKVESRVEGASTNVRECDTTSCSQELLSQSLFGSQEFQQTCSQDTDDESSATSCHQL